MLLQFHLMALSLTQLERKKTMHIGNWRFWKMKTTVKYNRVDGCFICMPLAKQSTIFACTKLLLVKFLKFANDYFFLS